MTLWSWLIAGYLGLAFVTFLPTMFALLAPVKLNGGGASFDESDFSEETKDKLKRHYSRMKGTLAFWKREATRNARLHYYCLWWTIVSSSLMPFLTQAIDANDAASKWFLTTVAAHIALMLGFHRGLKVAEHFKAFRHGESEFYDTYRRFLDRPESFGPNETAQVTRYFEEVEVIRRFVRNAETDSLPTVEDVRDKLTKPRQMPNRLAVLDLIDARGCSSPSRTQRVPGFCRPPRPRSGKQRQFGSRGGREFQLQNMTAGAVPASRHQRQQHQPERSERVQRVQQVVDAGGDRGRGRT